MANKSNSAKNIRRGKACVSSVRVNSVCGKHTAKPAGLSEVLEVYGIKRADHVRLRNLILKNKGGFSGNARKRR